MAVLPFLGASNQMTPLFDWDEFRVKMSGVGNANPRTSPQPHPSQPFPTPAWRTGARHALWKRWSHNVSPLPPTRSSAQNDWDKFRVNERGVVEKRHTSPQPDPSPPLSCPP